LWDIEAGEWIKIPEVGGPQWPLFSTGADQSQILGSTPTTAYGLGKAGCDIYDKLYPAN
jgi:hypothetical protein